MKEKKPKENIKIKAPIPKKGKGKYHEMVKIDASFQDLIKMAAKVKRDCKINCVKVQE